MAACYIRELETIQPQGPYLLGGWSFGGIVAYEMAQQLAAKGQKVNVLILLDCAAPQPGAQQMRFEESARMAHFASILAGQFGKELSLPVEELQALAPDQQLDYVFEKAKNADILPPDIEIAELRRLYENVFEPNLQALSTYQPQPYAERILLLLADEQIDKESSRPKSDFAPGWNELAPGKVEVHRLPGNHFTLVQEPNVEAVSALIKTAFQQEWDAADMMVKNAVP
jgi:thioesterase domain-containing protein